MKVPSPILVLPVLLSLLIGCQNGSAIIEESRDRLGLSVLAVNLRGIHDVPCQGPSVLWRERYKRIAQWMGTSGKRPDIIAIQELPGVIWCPFNHERLKYYSAANVLLTEIRNATGQEYRIAYLVDEKTREGFGGCAADGGHSLSGCQVYGTRALFYRPEKLRNMLVSPNDLGVAYNDTSTTGPHLRRSLPCCKPAPGEEGVCSLIDGPPQRDRCPIDTPSGLVWLSKGIHAAFTRFQLVAEPESLVHFYNIHLGWERVPGSTDSPVPAVDAINQLVTAMEARYPQTERLYPPILAGDFNMSPDGSIPDFDRYFERFQIALWSPEVMGMLRGKSDSFSSKQTPYAVESLVLPGPGCETKPEPVESLWSDHCGLYLRFEPAPR